jgi:exonuclease SbcD
MIDSSSALTVIHTSDWHLGHELNGHDRQAEHDAFLDWLLEQVNVQAADVLLVTGDVYDIANPPVSAMRRLFRFLHAATASRPGLQVVILGGNHDSAGRIDLPSALLGDGRVHFIGALPRREGALDFDRLLIPLRDPQRKWPHGWPPCLSAARAILTHIAYPRFTQPSPMRAWSRQTACP